MKRGLSFCILFFCLYSSYTQQGRNSNLNLFFELNKYDLTNKHLLSIDSALTNKKVTITCIKGFADSTGANSYNLELSRKRAWTIYKYLKNQHYTDSVNIEYFGEHHSSGKDISYERRVEICFKESSQEEKNNPSENNIADTLAITEKYELANIYFIPDKAIIDPASFFAVDDAAKYLKRFPGCRFEIVGHVNYVLPPSVMNNPKAAEPAIKLSEERAKAVYDLLAERDIPIESMTHKGVGNSQMVFKNPKNDEEKRKNMRVEILISCKK